MTKYDDDVYYLYYPRNTLTNPRSLSGDNYLAGGGAIISEHRLARAWYCVLLNCSPPHSSRRRREGGRSGNAWKKVKVSDSHRNNQEAGEARSLSSQYQPSLTRQMAEPFVFLLSSILRLEPAQPARRNVLKTLKTIRKNLSWKLTHSNLPCNKHIFCQSNSSQTDVNTILCKL